VQIEIEKRKKKKKPELNRLQWNFRWSLDIV